MLLNLAMDYCNETFLYEIAAEFGKLIGRYIEDPTSRTLHICVFGNGDVPRSIVKREPQRYGGIVLSWYVPSQ
jgi:hypothetical protein